MESFVDVHCYNKKVQGPTSNSYAASVKENGNSFNVLKPLYQNKKLEDGTKDHKRYVSGVLDFLLDRTALRVGRLRKVGINLQLRHIGLHRVELHRITRAGIYKKKQINVF